MNAFEKYESLPYGETATDEDVAKRKHRDNFLQLSHQMMDQELRAITKSLLNEPDKTTTPEEFLEVYCIFHEIDKGGIFEGPDL